MMLPDTFIQHMNRCIQRINTCIGGDVSGRLDDEVLETDVDNESMIMTLNLFEF